MKCSKKEFMYRYEIELDFSVLNHSEEIFLICVSGEVKFYVARLWYSVVWSNACLASAKDFADVLDIYIQL